MKEKAVELCPEQRYRKQKLGQRLGNSVRIDNGKRVEEGALAKAWISTSNPENQEDLA